MFVFYNSLDYQGYEDWYITTARQLAISYMNNGLLNQCFLKNKGKAMNVDEVYLLSTESSDEREYAVQMHDESIGGAEKQTSCNVRFIRSIQYFCWDCMKKNFRIMDL